MELTLHVLGSSAATPTRDRNLSSTAIRYRNKILLFDCGEDFQRRFAEAGLKFNKPLLIFISHFHGDHVLGIPGLLQTLAHSGYNKTLFIYGPKGTKEFMKACARLFVREALEKVYLNGLKIAQGCDLASEELKNKLEALNVGLAMREIIKDMDLIAAELVA